MIKLVRSISPVSLDWCGFIIVSLYTVFNTHFRAFDHIFETVSVTEGTKFLLHASYCEIYNEEIRDLLSKDVKAKLDLHEHPERGVYVNGRCFALMVSVLCIFPFCLS